MMRAIVYEKYGPPEVLKITRIPIPSPKKNEILVKNHATTVTAEDPKQRGLTFSPFIRFCFRLMFGFNKPKNKILGIEFAGEVVAIGESVSRFRVGDKVYGYTGLNFGAYAEFVCLSEDTIITTIPGGFKYEEMAAIPNSVMSSLAFLVKLGKIQQGEKVLINGASGSLGTAAIQIIKYFKGNVTGICSTKNISLIKSLGADKAIDYTKEDLSRLKETYDIIFDVKGGNPYLKNKQLLKENGRYITTEFTLLVLFELALSTLTKKIHKKKLIAASSNMYWSVEDLIFINKLISNGRFKPVIDRKFSLEQIQEAHLYVENGHKSGNVVINIE